MTNRLMHKNKKAQFYIFVAILLCVSAYGLISTSTQPKSKVTDFDVLSKNYISEANNVFNQALYQEKDVAQELDYYTKNFIAYAKTKNTDFKVLYMAKTGNATNIVNYLKKEANITTINQTLNSNSQIKANSTSHILIIVDNDEYNYTFSEDENEFKALIIR